MLKRPTIMKIETDDPKLFESLRKHEDGKPFKKYGRTWALSEWLSTKDATGQRFKVELMELIK